MSVYCIAMVEYFLRIVIWGSSKLDKGGASRGPMSDTA